MTMTRRVRLAAVAGTLALASWSGAARAEPSASVPAEPAPAEPASPATTPATATSPTTTATTEAPPPPVATGSRRTAWPWIVMGTGVALLGTALVFQVRAVSEDDQRQSDEVKLLGLPGGDPGRQALQDSAASHHSSATSSRTAALLIGAAGFVTVAGSVVWWFFEGGDPAPAAAARAPRLVPALQPGYAGGTFSASF
jgi:hypothetical protein